jgi:hypothetical protein
VSEISSGPDAGAGVRSDACQLLASSKRAYGHANAAEDNMMAIWVSKNRSIPSILPGNVFVYFPKPAAAPDLAFTSL